MANHIPINDAGGYRQMADHVNDNQSGPSMSNQQRQAIPFINNQEEQFSSGDPRKENFFRMLKTTFCPKVRLLSVTFLIFAVCTIMFIVCESVYGLANKATSGYVDGVSQRQLLQADYIGMKEMGAMNQQLLAEGQVYRLISANFLHWDFLHLFFNMVSLLSIMSFLEISYGPVVTLILFLLTGLGGNIFSACVSSGSSFSYSAGASCAIFGLVGCWIAFMILNWRALGQIMGEEMRCMMMCMVILNSMLVFVLSSYGTIGIDNKFMRIDTSGHFGGFLTGILAGLFIPKELQPSEYTKGCKMIGIALTSLFFLLNFVLFYTVKAVDKD